MEEKNPTKKILTHRKQSHEFSCIKTFFLTWKKKIGFSPSFEHHKRVKSVCRLNHINWALELCNNSSKSALRLPNNIRFAEVQRFLFFFFSHTLHRIIAGVSSQNAIVQQQQFASKWTHYFLITLFCLFKSPLIIYYLQSYIQNLHFFLKLELLLFHTVFYIKYRVSQQVLDRT